MGRSSPVDIRDGRPFYVHPERRNLTCQSANTTAKAILTLLLTVHFLLSKVRPALRAFRPIVYICSPFSGDIEKNVAAARAYSRFAVEQGYIPIAPHLLFPQFLNDSDQKERELGLFFGNAIMSKCSEVWVFGSHISSGMEAEIKRAKRKNYRLRYFTENLEEV